VSSSCQRVFIPSRQACHVDVDFGVRSLDHPVGANMANMQAMARTPYGQLQAAFTQGAGLEHAINLMRWDAMVNLAPRSGPFRADAIAELETALHAGLRDKNIPRLIAAVRTDIQNRKQHRADASAQFGRDPGRMNEPEKPGEMLASLREMERVHRHAWAVDPELTRRRSQITSEAEQAWRGARQSNNWGAFEKNLAAVLEITVEEGKQLALSARKDSAQTTAHVESHEIYDALLDKYEPGVKAEALEPLFADLVQWVPAAVRYVAQRDAAEQDPTVYDTQAVTFDVARQRKLAYEMAAVFGLDMMRARLDESSHPFCGGVPTDVRITTRFNPHNVFEGLLGVIHETGHGRYEQGLPSRHHGLPVGKARSMGIHESQSLLCEMQIARSDAFLQFLGPKLEQMFPEHASSGIFAPSYMARHIRRVRPGAIRVNADELCYPLHVALRFELERGLVAGSISLSELPALWRTKMQELLGVELQKDDYANGVLQDIHWPMGAFGYFPTYTLGAAYAAQMMASITTDLGGRGEVDKLVAGGDHVRIINWLRGRLWSKGSELPTPSLVLGATGSRLNPDFYRDHLMHRYVNVPARS
jgi:carboxypeptidase Taq